MLRLPGWHPSTFRTWFRILATVSIPDARRAGPGISWREKRAGPRHAAVWVRVGGRWRKGHIVEWVRDLEREGWEAVIVAEDPMDGSPWQGRYVYDRQAIRPRYNDSRPPERLGQPR
jgi:hypothetical protein